MSSLSAAEESYLSKRIKNASVDKNNAKVISDYMSVLKSEINPSSNYQKDIIDVLCILSEFTKHIPFKRMQRKDILAFLDSFRKSESIDPLHKWIGTYNLYRIHILKFFKWLYHPDSDPKKRVKPMVVENIPQLKRKEISIYRPTDLWTIQDDLLFLRYCPDPRIRCYHTMAGDSAARPHELLNLKIKDVVFKVTPDAKKQQYAEIILHGKTGIRHVPLINSIPYIKDWLSNHHPQSGNSDSMLLCGYGKSLGKKIAILSLERIYRKLKIEFFPKLLSSSTIPEEDKQKIRELLKKPWNPYVRRHSSLTGTSQLLKDSLLLRQHAGWTPNSNMAQKYIHYFANQSSESLLEAYGLVTKEEKSINGLRPKQCPNCSESNKPDSKFCAKCKMILTYDAYNETIQQEDDIEKLKQQMKKMEDQNKNTLNMMIDLKEFMELSKKNVEYMLKSDVPLEEKKRLNESVDKMKKHQQRKYNLPTTN